MRLTCHGVVFEWRGPAPYHFVEVPEDEAAVIKDVAAAVTYGWGMVPATVTLGATAWTTALWPRAGRYVVPLKDWVREAEGVGLDDQVTIVIDIDV